MTVAGYVHLNPVRAAMVDAPESSPWTGYGAGCRGEALAQEGLVGLVRRVYGAPDASWARARAACAEVIGGAVPEPEPGPIPAPVQPAEDIVETDARGRPVRAGSLRALLRRRVAGFLHGGALGGERFLRRVSALLPPRIRRRARCLLDDRPELGLAPASGVREAS